MIRARWQGSIFARAISGLLSVLLVLGGPFEAWARAAALRAVRTQVGEAPEVPTSSPKANGLARAKKVTDRSIKEIESSPQAAAVLPVPLLPAKVVRTSPGATRGDPWVLFDGRAGTALEVAAGEPARIEITLDAPTKLAALSLLGPAEGTIRVFAQGEDFTLRPISKWATVPIHAAAGAWKRIETDDALPAQRLVVEWTGKTSLGPREMGLWGFAPPRRGVSDAELADRILAGAAPGAVIVRATPDEGRVARVTLGSGLSNQPAVFHAMLDRDPRSLSRAFLVYELSGLGHWTEAVRQINGLSIRGGDRAPSAMNEGGLQVEEIAPASLHQGENEIRFLPLPGLGMTDYGVRRVRVVGVPLARVVESPPGDVDGKERRLSLDAPSQVHDVVFELGKETDGHMLVRAVGVKSAPVRVDLAGLAAGWHRADVGRLPVTNAVAIALEGAKARPHIPSEDNRRIVSDVALTASALPRAADEHRLAVSYPLHGECVDHKAYVRGFVATPSSDAMTAFRANGSNAKPAVGEDASFALTVPEPDFFVGRAWDVTLEATLASGEVLRRVVQVGPCLDPAKKSDARLVEDEGAPFGEVVRAGEAKTLAFAGMKLEIPEGAVDKDVRITVRPLVAGQVPAMSRGMANVSPDGRAFRFGPHGLQFKKPVKITLPYDAGSFEKGLHERDIFSFYYDEPLGKWQRVGRIGGAENGTLASLTEHFTDFVNATLAMPDSPGPASFDPNAMKGIALGSPSAGIDMISAPAADSSGAAKLSFPIEVPPGRNGVEPHLAFTYDSEQANGWLGVGWDLAISGIEIDTRFGAPSFNSIDGFFDKYLLDGEQLTAAGDGGVVFQRRVEGRFERIERQGASTCVTGWKVTDKSGTVFTYGGDGASLSDPDNPCHVFRWGLASVQDTFGNVMQVSYAKDTGHVTDGNGNAVGDAFSALYPASIDYTSSTHGLAAPYHVAFVRDDGSTRPDVIVSGRAGFHHRTRHRLDHVDVMYQSTVIRRYQLTYQPDSVEHLHKSLLSSIGLRGLNGTQELEQHTFDYRAAQTTTVNNRLGVDGFAPVPLDGQNDPVPWGALNTGNPLGRGTDTMAGLAAEVGFGFGPIGVTVGGGGTHGSSATNRGLLDLNGDALPDLVVDRGNTGLNFLRPFLSVSNPDPGHVQGTSSLVGLENLGHTDSSGWNVKAGLSLGPAGASVGYSRTGTDEDQILSDLDGDGFVDYVTIDDGTVRWRRNRGDGTFESEKPLLGSLAPSSNKRDAAIGQQNPNTGFRRIAPLIRWTAPYSGTVTFAGAIRKLAAGGNGLVASVFQNGSLLWQRTIAPGDRSACVPEGSNGCGGGLQFAVSAGDRIYTELSPFHDPNGPATQIALETIANDTEWSPTIAYQVGADQLALKEPYGAPIYVFSQREDHRVAGQPKVAWSAAYASSVHIEGTLVKQSTSDDVNVTIARTDGNGTVLGTLYSTTLAGDSAASVPVSFDADVGDHDGITFQVQSTTPIDPSRIQWTPVVTYKTYCKVDPNVDPPAKVCGPVTCTPSDTGPICLLQNDPVQNAHIPPEIISQPAQVFFPIQQTLPATPTPSYVASSAGTVSIQGTIAADPTAASVTVLVQGVNRLYARQIVPPGSAVTLDTSAQVAAGDQLFVTVYGDDERAARVSSSVTANGAPMPVVVRYRDARFEQTTSEGFPADPMAGGYHRWFSGFYDGDIDFAEANIVFPLKPDGTYRQTPPPFDFAAPRQYGTGNDPRPVWIGPGSAYVLAGVQGPSRAGSVGRRTASGNLGSLRNASTWNVTYGVGVAVAGLGGNFGETNTDHDFFDFNGDRYPDAVSADGMVQFNDHGRGFFSPASIPNLGSLDSLRKVHHGGVNAHLRADIQLTDVIGTDLALTKTITQGFSAGIDYGQSTTPSDWVDVNGDNLPDYVQRSPNAGSAPFLVRLNYGYRLGEPIPWAAAGWQTRQLLPRDAIGPIAGVTVSKGTIGDVLNFFGATAGVDAIRAQDSGTTSLGVGVSTGVVGGGGGVSYNATRTLVDLIDVTGDGLPDQVMKASDASEDGVLRVRQNLGDRFGDEVLWKLPTWGIDGGRRYGFLGTLDDGLRIQRAETYSADFEIRICFFLCVGVSGFWSRGTNSSYTGFEDVDGDALPDMVYKGDGQQIFAKLNKLGGVNLLSAVHRPLGGALTLAYEREGNLVLGATAAHAKVDEPANKYVLSKTDIDDGRGNHYVRSYHYEPSGVFDRVERDDYGFASVTTTREDASTVEVDTLNQDFYRKGFVAQILTRDAAGALFESAQRIYADPSFASPAPLTGSFFPAEQSRTSNWYEGQTNDPSKPGKTTTENRAWDANGNLTDLEVLADVGTGDDVIYHVDYDPALAANHIFRPSEVTARGRDGTKLRDRTATYFGTTAALKTLTNVVIGGKDPATGSPYTGDPATNPTWQFQYDLYGNLQQTVDPRGYTVTYGYDDVARTYRTSILDSFGYLSTSVPNYFFGSIDATNDVNQQTTLFHYDDFGRLASVFGPNDVGSNEPTIAFSYSQQGVSSPLPAYAITAHKDVRHPGDPVVTATFADGLDRIIQTKKDIEKDTGTGTVVGMSVSGAIGFDVRGRLAQQGQPTFDTSDPATFVLAPMVNPTSFTYDVIDRTRSVQTPDGALSTTTYGFDTLDGVVRLSTTVRDPNVNAGGGLPGAVHESFRDVRDLVLAVKETNRLTGAGPTTLVTRYAYNPVEELTQVTDAKGNVTAAEYDTVGRMVALTSPDAGRTEWRYDLSGNLGAKQSARLRAAGQTIRYHHDFNRLRQIEYPTIPAVSYVYGDPAQAGDAAGNLAGRIAQESSEAGTQSYVYDRLGNIAAQRWDLTPLLSRGDPQDSHKQTMLYSYDSFGRLLSMQYPGLFDPDEEVETVTYGYDRGGNVTNAIGVTLDDFPHGDPITTPYLNFIGYDEFGQRTRLVSGNGITTSYAYDPLTRRMTEVNSDHRDRPMQRLRYAYDRVGNITQMRNDAPFDESTGPHVHIGTSAQNFTYDDLYQLKTANGVHQEEADERLVYGLAFSYDAIGNIVQKTQEVDAQRLFKGKWGKDSTINDVTYTSDYTYGGPRPHAPSQIVDTLPAPGQGRTRTRVIDYDANGNQAEQTYGGPPFIKRTLTWDDDDRLQEVIQRNNQQLARALYDGAGDRLVSLQGQEEETAYFGQNLTLRDGKLPTKHIFAGGERIASKTGEGPEWRNRAQIVYFHDDRLGSTNFLTDDTQELIAHEEYLPTGELWVDETTPSFKIGPRYLFTGKELDPATGLYYFGARYYDPRLSQWSSPDPILNRYMSGGPAGGVFFPRNLGLYTYAANRPTVTRDNDGRIIDTVLDVGFLLYDVGSLIHDEVTTGGENRALNLAALGADAVATLIPGVTGAGVVVRAGAKGAKVVEGARVGEKIVEGAKAAEKAVEAGKTVEKAAEGTKAAEHAAEGTKAAEQTAEASKVAETPRPCEGGSCGGPGVCFVAGTPVVTDYGMTPIERVKVGDRVPTGSKQCATDHIDATWKDIRLELPNPDAPLDLLRIELIRPASWLQAQTDGDRAWLELEELGISGWATIVSVSSAPQEKPGGGCLVLMTVNHVASKLLRLGFVETAQSLELTPGHRLYAQGRGWMTADQLAVGMRLRTDNGVVTLRSVDVAPANRAVYNFEVGRDHTYRVLDERIWSHNACPNKETGSYTNTHASGKTYSGKGSRERSQASGRRVEKETGDQHVATEWVAAPNATEAFKAEARRIKAAGGPKDPGNYNKIESPGKKLLP